MLFPEPPTPSTLSGTLSGQNDQGAVKEYDLEMSGPTGQKLSGGHNPQGLLA